MNGGARVRRARAATDMAGVPATSGNTTDYDVNFPCVVPLAVSWPRSPYFSPAIRKPLM